MRFKARRISGYVQRFVVEGRGQFPLDMLRYDECYPCDGVMNMVYDTERRKVTLMRIVETQHQPTVERWQSFGWDVVKSEYLPA